MEPTKVEIILDWCSPRSLRDIKCFLAFSNFYRKFIKRYSEIVLPLIYLTQKNCSFIWTFEVEELFLALKKAYLMPRPSEPAFNHQKQILLGPSQLHVVEVSVLPMDSSILDVIQYGIPFNTFVQ
jgi:hypothetical protein